MKRIVIAIKFVIFAPWHILTSVLEVFFGIADLDALPGKKEQILSRGQ